MDSRSLNVKESPVLTYILNTLITAVSLLVADYLIAGIVLNNFTAAVIAGVMIGLVNGLIRPVIFILSLPFTIVTLGAFMLVVNGFCFWLASVLTPGFQVDGFWAFVLGPIVLSIASTVLIRLLAQVNRSEPTEADAI
jgi:putative membrane protein